MPTQTKTWQKKILQAAAADEYRDLFWAVEVELRGGSLRLLLEEPKGFIPVVPVAADKTGAVVSMLVSLTQRELPEATFASLLVDASQLHDVRFYNWLEGIQDDQIQDTGCAATV